MNNSWPPGKTRDSVTNPSAVSGIVDKGSLIHVTASLPPELICMVTRHAFTEMGLRIGQPVFVAFPASSVHLFKD